MIRINLLPSSKRSVSSGSKQFILLLIIALIAEAGLLFYLQSEADNDLAAVNANNKKISAQIKTIQAKTSVVAALDKEKEMLERQKEVLKGLIEGQSGPSKVLFEFSQLLRKVEDPEEKLRVQNLGWNPDWDPKNLWIDSIKEAQRVLTIEGHARNNEDLSQFLHRLNSSKHFHNVELSISQSTTISAVKNYKFVKFKITALALYGPGDVRKLAAGSLTTKKKRRRR